MSLVQLVAEDENLQTHFLVVRMTWYILHIFYAKLFEKVIFSKAQNPALLNILKVIYLLFVETNMSPVLQSEIA